MTEPRTSTGKPFFVVGPGRSGTTLLRTILDCHDDIRVPGETHFYTTFRVEHPLLFHSKDPARFARLVHAFATSRHFDGQFIDRERFVRQASEGHPPQAKTLLLKYLEHHAAVVGASCFGEKTPGHIRALHKIRNDFGDVPIIVVMRNPHAVVASYLNHSLYARVFGDDVMRAVNKWIEAAKIVRARLRDPKLYLLTYEDLVTHPESEIDRLFDFLGVGKQPDVMERVQAHGASIKPASKNHSNIGEPVTTARIDAWWDRLSEENIALIDTMTESHLGLFGYAPAGGKARASRLKVARRQIRFQARFAQYGVSKLSQAAARKLAP